MKNLRSIFKTIRLKFSQNEKTGILQKDFDFYKKFQNIKEEQFKDIESSINSDEKECADQFFNVFYKHASVHDQIQFELYVAYQRLKQQDPQQVFIDYTYLDQDSITQGNVVEKFYQQQQALKQSQIDMVSDLDLSQIGNAQEAGNDNLQQETEQVDPTVYQKETILQNNIGKFQCTLETQNHKRSQRNVRNWFERCNLKRLRTQQKKHLLQLKKMFLIMK